MTKTVTGSAMMLSAMATGEGATDYVSALDADSLSGLRIGVLDFARGSNADIHGLFDAAVSELEAAGAEIVHIEEFSPKAENFWAKARSVLYFEFKATINEYLAAAPEGVKPRNLDELIAFNLDHADIELALFDQSIFDGANEKGGLDSEDYISDRADILSSTREHGIDFLLSEHNVDVLVSPSGPVAGRIDPINGDVWPAWAGAGWMAAIAGYPHLTVPMGTVHGMPVGVSFMGAAGDDANILSYGFAYEQATNLRAEPQFLSSAESREEVGTAMESYLRRAK